MNVLDVARRAGVSAATVSRVFNRPDTVSSETRTKVLRVVEQLGYHPNVNARSLSAGQNRTLGVIVSNLDNPYFVDIFRAIEARAQIRGYEVLLADTNYSPDRLAASVRLMIGRRVGGLAVIVSEMEQTLVKELARSKIRVVFSGVDTPGQAFTNIRVNCTKVMQHLVRYLCSLGHRKMAFIGHHSALGTINERVKAFSDLVARYESELLSVTCVDSDSIAGGRQACRDVLASGFDPTAFVCVNDLMAIGVLKELRERGIQVPAEISVTGFDNISFSEVCTPTLTTVNIPRDTIAQLVFENLVGERQAPPTARDVVIDPELVLRDSTGPPRAE